MTIHGNQPPVEQLLIDVAEYSPVLPDSVTQLLLSRAGLDTESDPRVARIAALAAQKFISDILLDAFQCTKNRQSKERVTTTKQKHPQKNILTMDDLQQASTKLGISLKKSPYFH